MSLTIGQVLVERQPYLEVQILVVQLEVQGVQKEVRSVVQEGQGEEGLVGQVSAWVGLLKYMMETNGEYGLHTYNNQKD